MKVAVWDTYVERNDGGVMHFDIIAPDGVKDAQLIYTYGQQYLKSKNQENQPLTANECKLCHIEQATPEVELSIAEKGYYILEMQGCH